MVVEACRWEEGRDGEGVAQANGVGKEERRASVRLSRCLCSVALSTSLCVSYITVTPHGKCTAREEWQRRCNAVYTYIAV